MQETGGSIPGLGRSPGEGNGNPLQYSCLENPQGQRSLADYNPWGHKESDMTEQLSMHALSTYYAPRPWSYRKNKISQVLSPVGSVVVIFEWQTLG